MTLLEGAGCEYTLRPDGDGNCVALMYHLIQTTGPPAAVKDQAWFLDQLRDITYCRDVQFDVQWCYMLDQQ